uniref:Secreted protein n=1 Tax=Oryza barthii TaxID=65489 RepID=A0A0D3HKX1_9ORYZ
MAHPARSIQIHLCLALLSRSRGGDSARGEAAAQAGRRRAKGGVGGASSSGATRSSRHDLHRCSKLRGGQICLPRPLTGDVLEYRWGLLGCDSWRTAWAMAVVPTEW